ncbi:UNVERIFIED_CONTAM: hypothetical protein Sindi_0971700 [Sesamum indicum]
MGETPFCLVYGTEAIILAEIGEESQRIMQYDPEANRDERSFDLTVIEEKREVAYAQILHHKGLMMKSHDRKIRPRQLQVGDLVLKKVEASKHIGKLEPPWEGPYKVTEIRKKGKSYYGACERPSTKKIESSACERPSTWRRSNSGAYERPSTKRSSLVPVKGHQPGGGRILEPVKGHQQRDRVWCL